jgi:hypothetical protein
MKKPSFVLAVFATLTLAVGTANANTTRVTKGDAEAILNTFGNAGWAIRGHGQDVLQGAPADGLVDGLVIIRPLSLFDGKHYCALDWHVIAIASFDGGDASYTAQDFEAYRATVVITITLDGQAFATDATASRRSRRDLTEFGITTSYYYTEGRVVAPDELTVGQHTLAMSYTDIYESDLTVISFTIDAPGTGVCL